MFVCILCSFGVFKIKIKNINKQKNFVFYAQSGVRGGVDITKKQRQPIEDCGLWTPSCDFVPHN